MTFEEFMRRTDVSPPPGIRRGQWLFNQLHAFRPNFANTIRGTARDPFYEDSRIPVFLAYIAERWDA